MIYSTYNTTIYLYYTGLLLVMRSGSYIIRLKALFSASVEETDMLRDSEVDFIQRSC